MTAQPRSSSRLLISSLLWRSIEAQETRLPLHSHRLPMLMSMVAVYHDLFRTYTSIPECYVPVKGEGGRGERERERERASCNPCKFVMELQSRDCQIWLRWDCKSTLRSKSQTLVHLHVFSTNAPIKETKPSCKASVRFLESHSQEFLKNHYLKCRIFKKKTHSQNTHSSL